MIGDMSSPDVFTSSERFADYWENSASLTGSLLVYNTGEGAACGGMGVGRGVGWGGVECRGRLWWGRGLGVHGGGVVCGVPPAVVRWRAQG